MPAAIPGGAHAYRLRLVAADASTVRFGLRASHVKRAADSDQLVFGLLCPKRQILLPSEVST